MAQPLPPDRETLRREYAGIPLPTLAKRYCVPRKTILKWLDIFGIPARRAGRPKGSRGKNAATLVDTDGFVLLWRPDHPDARKSGYIVESRFVMGELLGRPLLPTEIVLHRDGNRRNNSPGNIYLADRHPSALDVKKEAA